MTKGNIKKIAGAIVLLLALIVVWSLWFSPTRIAFINYQVISLGNMAKANENSFIKINELSSDNIDKISAYDMVFINGMGLRITEDQRAVIQKAADKGVPIISTAVTNPDNDINNIDSVARKTISSYLSNGSRKNYNSLFNFIRKNIDKKAFRIGQIDEVVINPRHLIYHPNLKDKDDDDLGFGSIKEINDFFMDNGLYDEDAPRVIVTGAMGEPTDLILRLEQTGNMVYPINSLKNMIETGQIDSISPSAIVNMAHGRMGDYIVDYLTKQNIPLFAPLSTNQLVEDWEADKMGMSGGMLSQSVVTPEIDGAIRPYAVYGHYKDENGLQYVKAIPERLESFVETINNYIALKTKKNSDKRVAIYYYKGAGQNAMTAGGLEVGPSMFNFLLELKKDGYKVEGLPSTSKELERMIQQQGALFGSYAEGAQEKFIAEGRPELITKEEYESWVKKSLRDDFYAEVVAMNGEFPGKYMSTEDGRLGVARLQFGNIVLLPQNAAGAGDDSFAITHGTDAAPPHPYIASYLWTQYGFKADVLMHFGTHGSLEFTPSKQVALSSLDWPDRLVGTLPHFYIYSISNVGEGIIAKRRSYAGLQSHLTPPFLESSVRGIYRDLTQRLKVYNNLDGDCDNDDHDHSHDAHPQVDDRTLEDIKRASLAVKAATVKLGIHAELGLDSILTEPYTQTEILRIENFAEELATEKITGELYSLGVPYETARITSSIYAMTTEPIAYSLYALDKLRDRASSSLAEHKTQFTASYINPAKAVVTNLLYNPSLATDSYVCRTAGITQAQLDQAREIYKAQTAPNATMNRMMAAMDNMYTKSKDSTNSSNKPSMESEMSAMGGGHPGGMGSMKDKMPAKKEYTKNQINFAMAVIEVENTIMKVNTYKKALLESPAIEFNSLLNALSGGYTKPSPGGDPIANPNTIPTGRNLFSIDAEATPSEAAWDKGVRLANNTIKLYQSRHNDSIPRKVSYTLWSGEFIETGGATIAQILYMLGVEPIRDTYGRVSDLRLIPSAELGRPRIDVVVQTSGQLRDLAASRLFLINRAVEMAAAATDDVFENQVTAGVVESERTLIEKGLTPKDAREIAAYRVFGGANGGYGTGIQGMVMSSDRWEDESEIAATYINNMGAYYGNEKNWEIFQKFAFEAALTRTDAVIQPRQSNTWGALSLDHVYEFMGGLNLAVRNVTGKDPDAYLSDYRNRNNVKMQEVKEAIGVESRTTILNPTFIKEKMKGEAGSADVFAATLQNTFGWNVMKPNAIEDRLWDDIHDVYVNDKYDLNIKEFFETQNPAALEEMTAVMLESVRKGMWQASEQQIKELADLHTELVNKYNPSCSGFVCNNAKLRDFISEKASPQAAQEYRKNINEVRQAVANNKVDANKGTVLKKEELNAATQLQTQTLNGIIAGIIIILAIGFMVITVKKRRKTLNN